MTSVRALCPTSRRQGYPGGPSTCGLQGQPLARQATAKASTRGSIIVVVSVHSAVSFYGAGESLTCSVRQVGQGRLTPAVLLEGHLSKLRGLGLGATAFGSSWTRSDEKAGQPGRLAVPQELGI